MDIAITIACLAGAAICIGLAIMVLRREQATRRSVVAQPPAIEPARVEIERDVEVPASAPMPTITAVTAEPKTEFLSREEVLAAAERRAIALVPTVVEVDPTTQSLSREEILAAAQRRRPMPPEPGTEMLPRTLVLARHQALAPKFDPKHVPEPTSTTAPPEPTSTGLTITELEPQLLVAERAFARWQQARESLPLDQLADGPERILHQALAVVVAASDEASKAVLEPALLEDDVGPHRRQVAALTLLLRNEIHALRLIDQRIGLPGHPPLAEHPQSPTLLRDVLSLWRGPETNWRFCEHARRSADTQTFWLERLDERRTDPGPELLRALLTSEDPEQLTRGVRLAKYHADPEFRRSIAQPLLTDMRHPDRRMAAVELALFDRYPTAWMFCRQMANAPEYPRATELVASFGSARDLEPLMRRLAGAHGDGLWRLCRSGRKAAATLAARRLQDTRGDELAITALSYVIGPPPNNVKSAEALIEHWLELAPTLADDRRYLHGELFGGTNGVRSCLSSRNDHHHRAFGDELFFRSMGKIRWPGRGFAKDTLAGVRAVGTPNIDFELTQEMSSSPL